MSYDTTDYHEVDSVGGGMHFLRDPLNCENLGMTVVEADPGWTGKEHDHADEGHEEVYLVIEGQATLVINGETVPLSNGEAVRVPPEATRQIQNGDDHSLLVIAGAP